MKVERYKSCWPCRKRYCSRFLVTESLENRWSYVPRTGVYEERKRPTSSKKRKKKLYCTVTCAGRFIVKLTKPWTLEIFMECYCVARNKPIRREITKPQTATIISLWFWGLLACPELYCDWPVHNQHSWKFSGVHGFLSLTVKPSTGFEFTLTKQRLIQYYPNFQSVEPMLKPTFPSYSTHSISLPTSHRNKKKYSTYNINILMWASVVL